MKKALPLLLFSATAYAACPYVPQQSAYVCDNITTNASTTPGQVSAGEYDARITASSAAQYGPRRPGGCVPVIRGSTISHYDCTTHALSQVPETVERTQYQTYWEREDEREQEREGFQTNETPGQTAERLVPVFTPR